VNRPLVVHVVREWLRPSETFVADTIRSTTATRSAIVYRQPLAHPAAAPAEAISTMHWLRAPLGGRPARLELAAFAARHRASAIHAHFGQPAGLVWRVARRLGLPFAVSLHGYDLLVESRSDSGMLDAIRQAALVVVPSAFLADAAAGAGVPDEIIRVIPSGLDLSQLPFSERCAPAAGTPVRVTFAGRFVGKKGILDAAEAMALAAAQGCAIRGRFVGFGGLEDALRRRLAELTAASNGRFTAEVLDGRPAGAVRAALADTDVLLTASRIADDGDAETLGLVNLEAQAMGVLVVAAASGGVREAVSAQAGVLVETGDVGTGDRPAAQLAAGLLDVLRRPHEWAGMGRAGRRHVAARFELGARTADLEEQWLALARTRRPAASRDRAPTTQTVSVVMVTRDRRALVGRALDALSAQSRPADEVLVVDNGSADGTDQLLAERVAAQRPSGLRLVPAPASLSVAEARNAAVAASSGDVIAFTDDDCRPRPQWLEALLAGFAGGVGLVQGPTVADPAQELRPLSRTQWTPAEFGLYETCNIAYRREALDAGGPPAPQGPFDLGFADRISGLLGRWFGRYPFGEDTELGWRVKRAGADSRFAVHAVVEHHVFPPDPALQIRRGVLAAGFPLLLEQVPELREVFLWHRYVLGSQRLRIWGALGGLGMAAHRREAGPLLLALPYAWKLVQPHRQGRKPRLRAAPVIIAKDLVETGSLVYGSARARRVVL
jgi:colanic acid/amylovoran biosynthesis glycosyltransferase